MSIEQKILNIVAVVEPLEKTAYNEISKYHYTPEADVKNYIRPFLVKEGLLLTYSVFQQEEAAGHAKIVMQYKFTDVSTKEVLEGMWCGGAYNHSGYAIQTAITAAVKQFLLTIFHIPTYDDLEAVSGCTPETKGIKLPSDGSVSAISDTSEVEVPPVVNQDKLQEQKEVVPGTKRRGRNARKALESVEQISEKTGDIQQELPIPEELPVAETPSHEAFLQPAVQKKHLLDIQHMLAGLAEGTIMAIEESVVSLIPETQDIYYAYKEDKESGEKKIVWAIKTPK